MIDRETGASLTGFQEYAQRVFDALTTPLGSRIKRRGYGSKVPDIQGRNQSTGNGIRLQVWAAQTFDNPINGLGDGQLLNVDVYLSESGYKLKLTLSFNGEVNQVSV